MLLSYTPRGYYVNILTNRLLGEKRQVHATTSDGEINKVDQIVELAGDIYGVELNRVLDSAKRFYVKLSLS